MSYNMNRWVGAEEEILRKYSIKDNWLSARELRDKYLPWRTIQSIENKRKRR